MYAISLTAEYYRNSLTANFFFLCYAISSSYLTPNIIPLKIRDGKFKFIEVKQIGFTCNLDSMF